MESLTKIITTVIIGGFIASCSIRNYQPPPTSLSKKSEFEIKMNRRFKAAKPVANWWSTFDDEDLDSLISRALKHNLNIAVAAANVRKTHAQLREEGFRLFPIVRADGGYTWKRQSKEAGRPIQKRNVGVFDVGLTASWELDLFGRISQAKKAAKAIYQANFAELRGVYVSVASEVALAYMQLRGSQYRLKVAKQNVANMERTYQLSKVLNEAGSGSKLDVSRAKSQLESARATIPPLKATIKSTINRLSVLTGNPPQALNDWLMKREPLPSVPPTVAIGDPTFLLRRRPDIRRAERRLAASVAQYNVEAASYFPKVSIIGSLGFVATSFANLFTGGALTAAVGPSISWAAFDLGRVDARVDAADAVTDARLAIYKRTVLQALEEVSNAMHNFSRQEERRRHLTIAARSAAKAAKLARQRYKAGLISFLDVLEAERRLLQAQDQLARSNIKVASYLIAIYKAMGGGWQVKVDNFASRQTKN